MKIQNARTLEHYLQEVIARQIVARLPAEARARVVQARDQYETLLKLATARLSADLSSARGCP